MALPIGLKREVIMTENGPRAKIGMTRQRFVDRGHIFVVLSPSHPSVRLACDVETTPKNNPESFI